MLQNIKKDEHGFSLVEALLVIIALALVFFVGYYVWHNQQGSKTSAVTAKASGNTAKPNTAADQKYLTITEWGVRAPYDGTDTLSYRMDSNNITATVISTKLALIDPGCSSFGAGMLARMAPNASTDAAGDGPTAEQAAANDPTNWKRIGNFYYTFGHDQASCGDKVTNEQENAANNFTKALLPKLEAIK